MLRLLTVFEVVMEFWIVLGLFMADYSILLQKNSVIHGDLVMFEQYWCKESQTLYKKGSAPLRSHSNEVSGQGKFNPQWNLIYLRNGLPADDKHLQHIWKLCSDTAMNPVKRKCLLIQLVAKLSAEGRFHELIV